MADAALSRSTLIATVWQPDAASRTNRWIRTILLAFLGTALLTVSAKIEVPFYPVPMTMQTFAVLVLGMTFGLRLGVATMILYLAEGAMGLPVFAGTPEKGIGIAYMLGGTGGYLVGFVLAAAVCGALAERGWDRSVPRCALVMLLANGLVYLPGLLWLGALYGWDKPILEWGLLPFLLGDAVKIALAAATLPLIWRFVGRSRPPRAGQES